MEVLRVRFARELSRSLLSTLRAPDRAGLVRTLAGVVELCSWARYPALTVLTRMHL